MRFDIQHGAAIQTVQGTKNTQPQLEAAFDATTKSLSDAGAALPHSPVVASALGALGVEVTEPTGKSVTEHVSNTTSCTSEALQYYGEGDQTMAQIAATNSSQANVSDIPGVR